VPRAVARLLASAAAALFAAGAFVWLSPAAAQAAVVVPATASPPPSTNLFCSSGNSSLRYEQQSASNLLPVDRWASATANLHTDFGGGPFGLGLDDLAQRVQRDGIESGALAAGNALWSAGTDMTAAAVGFCYSHSLGYTADHFAAVLGNAILSSGIVALLVAIAIVGFFWRLARRGENTWRSLARAIVVLGIFAAMIAGASASTPTSFGTFSPGWVITSVYSAMSNIASLPIMAIAQASDNSLTGMAPPSPDLLDCTNYTDQLLRNYQADYGTNPVSQAAASVPMALDAMWEQTGLRAYQDIQFGQQAESSSIGAGAVAVNDYGLRTYCRALDEQVGVPPVSQFNITNAGAADRLPSPPNYSSAAWLNPGDSNSIADASVIAWAACEYTGSSWSVDPGFTTLSGGHKVTVKDCENWWGTPVGSWGKGPFGWSTSTSAINNDASGSPQVADFLLNWHGDANGQAIATAITFLPASVAVFVVFLLLSGALIIAKMALLVVIILTPVVLVASVTPGRRWEGAATKLGKYGLGLMVFGVMAQLILSLVAIISSFLVQAGAALFSPGSAMTILWTALAPFAAIWLMHHLFKAIGAPSPFKLTGALGWATAVGGVGAGIGESFRRHTVGRASKSLKLAGRSATRSATRWVTQPPSRVGGLQPSPPVGTTAAGAARKGPFAGGAGRGMAGSFAGAAMGAAAAAASKPSQAPGAQGDGAAVPDQNARASGQPSWPAAGADGKDADVGAGVGGTGRPGPAQFDSSAGGPSQAGQRIWLDVPFGEKEEAKAAGAKWDPEARRWYATHSTEALSKWLPKAQAAGAEGRSGVGPEADSSADGSAAADSTGPGDDAPGARPESTPDGQATDDEPTVRTWLDVPYEESDEARAAGAQWDAAAGSWYVTGANLKGFERWVPNLSPRPVALSEHLRASEERRQAARYYRDLLAGPRPEKKPVRGAGAIGGAATVATNVGRTSLYRAKRAYMPPKEAVKERWREAKARFSQSPVRSTLKGLATAGVVGGAVLATPVSAGISAGVVGGIIAARLARRAHLEHPARKQFAERQRLEAWRAAQKARAEQERRERVARAAAAAPGPVPGAPSPTPRPKPGSRPGDEGHGHDGHGGTDKSPEPAPEPVLVGAGARDPSPGPKGEASASQERPSEPKPSLADLWRDIPVASRPKPGSEPAQAPHTAPEPASQAGATSRVAKGAEAFSSCRQGAHAGCFGASAAEPCSPFAGGNGQDRGEPSGAYGSVGSRGYRRRTRCPPGVHRQPAASPLMARFGPVGTQHKGNQPPQCKP